MCIRDSMDTMSAVSAPYTASNGNGITSVDFFVSDAAKLESIVQEVQNISSIDWDSYYVTVNNEVYERISSGISDTSTLVTTLVVIVTVVSMVPVSYTHLDVYKRQQQDSPEESNIIHYKNIILNVDNFTVMVNKKFITLTTREFEILRFLLENQEMCIRDRLQAVKK